MPKNRKIYTALCVLWFSALFLSFPEIILWKTMPSFITFSIAIYILIAVAISAPVWYFVIFDKNAKIVMDTSGTRSENIIIGLGTLSVIILILLLVELVMVR